MTGISFTDCFGWDVRTGTCRGLNLLNRIDLNLPPHALSLVVPSHRSTKQMTATSIG